MTLRRHNSLRLQDFNYAEAGAYFVTVVTYGREAILGDVKAGQLKLSRYGNLVADIWRDLPNRYSHVALDEFIVMPDHIHGIIWIHNVGAGSLLTSNVQSNKNIPHVMRKPARTNPQQTSHDNNVGAGSLLTLPENSNDEKMINTLKPAQTTLQSTLHGGLPRAGLKFTANQATNVPNVPSINEPAPTGGKSLSEIIRNFKTVSAKRINLVRRLPDTPVWQRGFHDRIIRDDEELNAVRLYIQTNPQRRAEQP
jgi:putative transposase